MRQNILDRHAAAAAAVTESMSVQVRLQVRFPDGHPVVVSYAQWRETIEMLLKELQEHGVERRTPSQVHQASGLMDQQSNALAAFLSAVQAWIQADEEPTQAA